MNASVAGLLECVRRHAPERLIPAEAFAAMALTGGRLPPVSGLGFECRFDGDRSVDLMVRLLPGDGTREAFAFAMPGHSAFEALFRNPQWARLRQLCRAWADPGSPLHRSLDVVWLEFDAAMLGDSIPVPGIFIGGRLAHGRAWVEAGIAQLLGRTLSARARDRLDSWLDRLPHGDGRSYFAAMPARGTSLLRVCAPVAGAAAPSLLEAASAPAQAERLARALEPFIDFADEILLHVDLGARAGPTVGFELRPGDRWPELCRRLAEEGLAPPGRLADLLDWPGEHSCLARLAPEPLHRRPPPRGSPWRPPLVTHRLNHVKIVTRPDSPPTAKGYLYAGFLWPPELKSKPFDPHPLFAGRREGLRPGFRVTAGAAVEAGRLSGRRGSSHSFP